MKKMFVFIAAALIAVSCAGLAACGEEAADSDLFAGEEATDSELFEFAGVTSVQTYQSAELAAEAFLQNEGRDFDGGCFCRLRKIFRFGGGRTENARLGRGRSFFAAICGGRLRYVYGKGAGNGGACAIRSADLPPKAIYVKNRGRVQILRSCADGRRAAYQKLFRLAVRRGEK